MKFSKKICIYISVLLFIFFVGLSIPGIAKVVLGITWVVLVFAGGAYAIYWSRRLERGIQRLTDLEDFRTYMAESKDKTMKDILTVIEKSNAAVKEKYSSKVMDRQSKINSLQSQINPHFLYNTLECIRSEAIFQGSDSIANMAKSLAAFFRYSISRRENMVTILDELNNIKNYFLIQNYRFENKFRLYIEVEDEEEMIYSYLIPKMTIQPIVENSIFHGLETKPGDCYVKIRFWTTEDKVILIISDNGIGMSEDSLERLRYGMEYGPKEESIKTSPDGNGIALYNVNQRIKLAFGNMYGLQVYSTQNAGTDIEIIMPMVTDKNILEGA